jgi:rare lipoprotein A
MNLDWIDDMSGAIWAGVWTAVLGVVGFALLLMAYAFWAVFLTPAHAESGIASVYSYGHGTPHGYPTACGVPFNPGLLTAAHRRLPCGTVAKITTKQGHSVIVRITDRGPFVRGRIVDLTPAAAHVLGFSGLAYVSVEAMRQ